MFRAGAWGGQVDLVAPLQGAGFLQAKPSFISIHNSQVLAGKYARAHLTVFLLQVKEVDKGQECGLGLDVKFEVLPVSLVIVGLVIFARFFSLTLLPERHYGSGCAQQPVANHRGSVGGKAMRRCIECCRTSYATPAYLLRHASVLVGAVHKQHCNHYHAVPSPSSSNHKMSKAAQMALAFTAVLLIFFAPTPPPRRLFT